MPPDDMTPSPSPDAPSRRTSPLLLLIVAWLVVGIPAAWGVWQTVMRSLDLFKSPPPVASPTAPAPANRP